MGEGCAPRKDVVKFIWKSIFHRGTGPNLCDASKSEFSHLRLPRRLTSNRLLSGLDFIMSFDAAAWVPSSVCPSHGNGTAVSNSPFLSHANLCSPRYVSSFVARRFGSLRRRSSSSSQGGSQSKTSPSLHSHNHGHSHEHSHNHKVQWDGTNVDPEKMVSQVQFTESGLIPAIAQQYDTGEILMMAWMNAESIRETMLHGRVVYYSRSRNQLWRKGDTSGQIQVLKDLFLDCDGDTILVKVDQLGVACHTGRRSCFYTAFRPPTGEPEITMDVLMDPKELYGSKKQ